MSMKLSEWAKKMGVSYETAWRWKRDGKIPHPVETIGRTTIVHDEVERRVGMEVPCPKCGETLQVDVEVR